MHRIGSRLSALLLMAFIAVHAQCLAYCALEMCPQTAQTTSHRHCPHHPANSRMPAHGAAHHCTAQEAFLVKAPVDITGLQATAAAASPMAASPAPAAAAPVEPGVDASPPLGVAPPPFVLRI